MSGHPWKGEQTPLDVLNLVQDRNDICINIDVREYERMMWEQGINTNRRLDAESSIGLMVNYYKDKLPKRGIGLKAIYFLLQKQLILFIRADENIAKRTITFQFSITHLGFKFRQYANDQVQKQGSSFWEEEEEWLIPSMKMLPSK